MGDPSPAWSRTVASWRMLDRALMRRSQAILATFEDHLPEGPILDVGAGTCHTVALLRETQRSVVALDVVDRSSFEEIRPVLYDGRSMPFRDGCFASAILQTTLHHAQSPERVVGEAVRVAHRLVVVEDVVRGPVHRIAAAIVDSLLNLQFRDQPHTNKSEAEWLELFESYGLHVVHRHERWKYLVIWQVTYVLDGTHP